MAEYAVKNKHCSVKFNFQYLPASPKYWDVAQAILSGWNGEKRTE